MKKIKCKDFKDNHVYYSTETDTIFLVDISVRPRFTDPHIYDNYYLLHWLEKGIETSSRLTHREVDLDYFYGLELGEL